MSEKTPEVAATEEDKGTIAYMFSNSKEDAERLFALLQLFYRGVYENTIGIMKAKDRHTDKERIVLVGIEHQEDGTTTTIPLVSVLDEKAVSKLLLPDGEGGWLEPEDQWTEVDATKH